MTPDERLTRALQGWLADWAWSEGLGPDVVAAAIGAELHPGPVRLGGIDRVGAVAPFEDLPEPVRFVWEADHELALVEITAPVLRPDPATAIAALGEPDEIVEFGRGPHPGAEQRVHLERGLTVFDGFNRGYTHVWLFRPTDLDGYLERLGATENVKRMRPDRGGWT